MDICLFAAQLLGLVMFLVDVEVASQMQVKMLQERRWQKKKETEKLRTATYDCELKLQGKVKS